MDQTTCEPGQSSSEEVKNPADFALAQRLIAGERHAWVEWTKRFESTIYYAIFNTLRSYGADTTPDRVEELQGQVLDVLIRNDYKRLRHYSGRSKLHHWLKVVAGNYTIDFLRKQRPGVSLDDDRSDASAAVRSQLVAKAPSTEVQLHRERALAKIRELAAKLPEDDRAFFELFFVEELGFAEIAERLNTTVGAIYARKNRVRKKLTKWMEEAGY